LGEHDDDTKRRQADKVPASGDAVQLVVKPGNAWEGTRAKEPGASRPGFGGRRREGDGRSGGRQGSRREPGEASFRRPETLRVTRLFS